MRGTSGQNDIYAYRESMADVDKCHCIFSGVKDKRKGLGGSEMHYG